MSDLREEVEARVERLLRERAERLRGELDTAMSRLSAPVELTLVEGDWGATGGAEQMRALRDALAAVTTPDRSQRDILSSLVAAAAHSYPRIALFILKSPSLVGWGARGFRDDDQSRDEDLAQVKLPATGDHLLARALQSRSLVLAGTEGPGGTITAALGGSAPRASAAIPILMRGKPLAVLYGDTGAGGGPVEELSFEIIARVGGLAMEALLGDTGRRTTAVASPAASRQREAALQPVAVHGSATPPEEAEMQALLEDLDGHPRRESGDNGAPRNQDERRDRADAQRFASLLVSEMMLYNEDAVILGRKHRDLHKRLQKEIERSRRAYAARVPAQLVASTNYLEEEMVRVLADGDRRLLAG